jgi:hypothetical protein
MCFSTPNILLQTNFAAQVQFPFVAHAMDGNFCALVPILVGDKMSRAHEAALAAQVLVTGAGEVEVEGSGVAVAGDAGSRNIYAIHWKLEGGDVLQMAGDFCEMSGRAEQIAFGFRVIGKGSTGGELVFLSQPRIYSLTCVFIFTFDHRPSNHPRLQLAAYLDDDDTLLVISTDLCRFGQRYGFTDVDAGGFADLACAIAEVRRVSENLRVQLCNLSL